MVLFAKSSRFSWFFNAPEKDVRKPSDIEMTRASDERVLNRFQESRCQVVQDVISILRLRVKS